MALPLPFDTQGLPTVNAIVFGGGGGAGVPVTDITPSAPVHGVTVAVNTDNSTLIATVQVGYRYRVTPIGTEGVVITNTATAAARATDEPLWPMQKIEVLAIATTIRAQKLVAGTANGSVNVVPLDGGTIA